VVFGYERKGFIRLKECFRVSKTEDHYQQFDSWRHSYFLLPLFFDLPFFSFFFFIALLEHTHFILVITFSCELGMPPSIWVSWALLPFGFLTALLSFLIIEISLAPSVGCDPSRDFFMKEKLFRLKKGSQGMYLFQNVKGITKMAFPHFKRKQLRSINFDLI